MTLFVFGLPRCVVKLLSIEPSPVEKWSSYMRDSVRVMLCNYCVDMGHSICFGGDNAIIAVLLVSARR